jgi:hypothetical protein
VLVTSCSDGNQYLNPTPSGSLMSQQQQYTELMNRPTIDEAIKRYEEMRATIRDRLTQEFNLSQWTEQQESSRFSGCAPQFSEVDQKDSSKKYLPRWFASSPLIASWKQAKQIVAEVSKGYGFNRVSLDVEKPDDVEFNLNDQYGAELSFGSAKNTVLTLTTGCHLSAEAKRRGGPRQSQN